MPQKQIEGRCIAPLTLNPRSGQGYVVNLTPWLPYPLNRRLGGPLNQSECNGEQKSQLPLQRFILSIKQPLLYSLYKNSYY
jgi:hypothetical protein